MSDAKALVLSKTNYRGVLWEAYPPLCSVCSRVPSGATTVRLNEVEAASQREAQIAPAAKALPPAPTGCLCAHPRPRQGSLQPQSYCARQVRTRPSAGRAWGWERAKPGSWQECAQPPRSLPPRLPGKRDAARGAGAPRGLVAPAPGAVPGADLSALRH